LATQTLARRFCAIKTLRVAETIADARADGLDGVQLLHTVDDRHPGLTLHDFVGGLVLYCAQTGLDGYRLVRAPGTLQ
jgi:hypothetical protein